MLVKNEIEIKNFDEIPAMLEAAQKKCRERLVSGDTIRDTLRRVEKRGGC